MPPPDYTGFWKLLYDWQTIIAGGAAIIGGVVAYVAGRIQARATRDAADRQIAAIKSTLQAESIIKLMDKFDSDEFQEKRKRAAQGCLNHLEEKNPGVVIEDILLSQQPPGQRRQPECVGRVVCVNHIKPVPERDVNGHREAGAREVSILEDVANE